MCFSLVMLAFFFLFVWLVVVALGVKTCVVVFISNNAHCLSFPNFRGSLSSFFQLCSILFICLCCVVMLNFIFLCLACFCCDLCIGDYFFIMFVVCFFTVSKELLPHFIGFSLLHSFSFVASHC